MANGLMVSRIAFDPKEKGCARMHDQELVKVEMKLGTPLSAGLKGDDAGEVIMSGRGKTHIHTLHFATQKTYMGE